jgi:hypothetical protein
MSKAKKKCHDHFMETSKHLKLSADMKKKVAMKMIAIYNKALDSLDEPSRGLCACKL